MPCALLLVIGDGPLRSQLESEALQLGISERTRFLGERADVPDLLDILDLYVQPSIFEGMPNAVMEAMAMGKPVIATNVDGTQELITHGETGWLVESCNPETLAKQIIYALQNRDECARVGRPAPAGWTVISLFSVWSQLMMACTEACWQVRVLRHGLVGGATI